MAEQEFEPSSSNTTLNTSAVGPALVPDSQSNFSPRTEALGPRLDGTNRTEQTVHQRTDSDAEPVTHSANIY